jgi:hypothetical protein
MQKQIAATREARERAKTVQEISDNQAKLSYMKQATGGNAVDILSLEKELQEQQEAY